MGGSKTKQTTNQQQTQTVQLPQWMSDAGQQNYSAASQWAAQNPVQPYGGQMTAPMSQNQQAANQVAAQSVGAGQSDLAAARAYTAAGAMGPAVWAQSPQVAPASMTAAQQGYTGYRASQADAPMLGNSPTVTYSPASAQQATAAMSEAAQRDPAHTYQAALQTSAAPAIEAMMVSTGKWIDPGNAQAYMNPFLANVQDRVTERMERENAEQRAQLNDGLVAAKAFGGSRQGVLESELMGVQNRNMLDYLAQSQAQGYDTAFNQFTSDQARKLSADQGNQSAKLQADIATSGFIDQMLGRNQSALNDAGRFNADAMNTRDFQNAGWRQESNMANADRATDVSKLNAQLGTDVSLANADGNLRAGLANQDWAGKYGLADQDAQLRTNLANAGWRNDASAFGASAYNNAQSANADRRQSAAQNNAQWWNTVNSANADRTLSASQTNASVQQQMLQRMLAAGGQFADYGSAANNLNTADITNLMRTGAVDQATQQQGLDAAYNEFLRMQDAPMQRWAQLAQILAGTPRDVTTNGTMTGTSTSQQKAGFLNQLLGIASMGASFI